MWKTFLMSCVMVLSVYGVALAHFGMVIPSTGTVTEKKDANVSLDLAFAHPMEGQGMRLAKPVVKVVAGGKTEDVTPSLKAKKIMDHDGWTAQYAIRKPGVYQFVMEPQPYWEPAEDCYIGGVVDDGMRLWVDGKLVVNKWTGGWLVSYMDMSNLLKAGKTYTLKFAFHEGSGGAVCSMVYAHVTDRA